MDLGLAGRVYLLTGASRGLGRATAAALVSDGARVVIASRSAEHVDQAVAELGADHAVGVVADNSAPESAGRLVRTAFERFGRLDGALVSVGGPLPGTVLDRTDEQWRAAFESIFVGGLRIARHVAERLDAGGSIVFVLSTSVKQPIPGLGLSNGLRPGLAMAAKALADELGPRGVRVNGLLPGRVDTERVQELDAGTDDPEETRRRHRATIPLRRYGTPEEFAAAAAFLLSPASSYITGAMVPVDGGITRGL